MADHKLRQQALFDALEDRILVIDGAMGSILHSQLSVEDYGGAALENCTDNVVLTRPDLVQAIHRQYLEAGAEIIETNSFNGHKISLSEFNLQDKIHAINATAARIAREVATSSIRMPSPASSPAPWAPPRAPFTVTRNVTFDELRQGYYEQAKALVDGGVDILLLETCQDTRNVKAALLGLEQLERELGYDLPIMVSGTIEPMGTMLAGQTADTLYASIAHRKLLSIGLNCATGPEFMTDHIRTLHEMASTRISCYPNAGIPNEELKYLETPDEPRLTTGKVRRSRLAQPHRRLLRHHPRPHPGHRTNGDGKKPRALKTPPRKAIYTGIELVEADDSNRPLIVGERTNVIGSRLFKNMIAEEKWEEASEIARRQVRNGAHIIDVCLQSTDRDEINDIPFFYEKLIRKCKAPIMIDTTDPKAVELSLTYCQGKSLINSINLEDGEEKFERMCPVAKAYGAAVVVGCIDEDKLQAQAFTRERKLAVAQRSVELLTTKYGIPAEDIVIDPLVFPCATGDENYIGGAVETIEAIRLIKEAIPYVKTVLGISNISFGLPAAAREVVNSVFLYYCTKAGLDLAIVNAEKLERFASLPPVERQLAENLLFNTPVSPDIPKDWREQTKEQRAEVNQFHIAAITEHFRGATARVKAKAADLPLDERLANYIIEGTKDGLIPDLDLKRAEGAAPLDIVNGPLMAGMAEVGRLFNNNELIVAKCCSPPKP
jgi:Methionine synthase I, cobalamin-binding domain